MDLSRRDFIKLIGISVAALFLPGCQPPPTVITCYAPTAPSLTPTVSSAARNRLRACWLSFGELTRATMDESSQGNTENKFGAELIARHRAALDELVTAGELTPAVADLVQEAFGAAVYHVWRSNAPITCYAPIPSNRADYAPASADVLVAQSEMLDELARKGNINPQTLANARAAIEHDMAFYALSDQKVQALYDHLAEEWKDQHKDIPDFEKVDLEITPDAKAAALYLIHLLTDQ